MQEKGSSRSKINQRKRDNKAFHIQLKRRVNKIIKNLKIIGKAIGILVYSVVSNIKVSVIRLFGNLKVYFQVIGQKMKGLPARILKKNAVRQTQKTAKRIAVQNAVLSEKSLEQELSKLTIASQKMQHVEVETQQNMAPQAIDQLETAQNIACTQQEEQKRLPALKAGTASLSLKERFQTILSNVSAFNKKRRNILVPICVVSLCLVIGIYVASFYAIGLNVYCGNDIIARTSDQEKFEDYIAQFDDKFSQEMQQPYQTDLNFYYEFSLVPKAQLDNFEGLEAYLINSDREVQQMYVLKVDGKAIGSNLDKQKMEEMLESIKNSFITGAEGEKAEFIQTVALEEQYSKVGNYKSIAELERMLLSKIKSEADHIVQPGETLSQIAQAYGMSTSELMELNSGVQETRLKIGSSLVVSQEQPVLSVKTIKTVSYAQPIAYGTQTQTSADMYKNQTKVQSEGVEGESIVTEEVTLINNVETQRVLLDSKVTKQPVDQVLLQGAKALPTTTATGSLRMPVNGTISSRYGSRGRGSHTGLDIAAPTGTPVYAADGGKVIFAGWSGGYGNIIKIDHGNGMQTWYAHLSSIGVRVGTSVAKGSKIGGVGSTGNSTGSHLHIEVRMNGNAVNPSAYLK